LQPWAITIVEFEATLLICFGFNKSDVETMTDASTSSLLGNGMLVIWGDVDSNAVDEETLNEWWTNEHLPERLSISGFRRARRYYSADDSSPTISKYLVCYEVSSLETLTSKEYLAKLNDPTPGTAKSMPVIASLERSACSVVYSAQRGEFAKLKIGPVGGTIVHIVFSFPELSKEKRQELDNWIVNQLAPAVLSSHHSILSFHALRPNEAAGKAGSSSKSYERVQFTHAPPSGGGSQGRSKLILLVEFSYTKSTVMKKSRSPMLKASLMEYLHSLGAENEANQLYELLCVANE
jgi:hypothetical protein